MDAPGSDQVESRSATLAGLAYTLIVFAAAFAVGAIRVTLVAPWRSPRDGPSLVAGLVSRPAWR